MSLSAQLDLALAQLARQLHIDRPLVAFDLETTGVDVTRDRIVEITVGSVRQDEVLGESVSLFGPQYLNPGMPIPAEATAVHGISDADVAEAPTFTDVTSQLIEMFVADRQVDPILVAYNGRRFDLRLLASEFERANHLAMSTYLRERAQVIDPYVIWQTQEPRDLTGAVRRFCAEDHTEAHGSLPDVLATTRVLTGEVVLYHATLDQLLAWSEPPRDPSWLDREGKIAWRHGEACLTFGKYAGCSLRELRSQHADFLVWMLGKDFPDDTKQIIRDALDRKFPVHQEAPSHA